MFLKSIFPHHYRWYISAIKHHPRRCGQHRQSSEIRGSCCNKQLEYSNYHHNVYITESNGSSGQSSFNVGNGRYCYYVSSDSTTNTSCDHNRSIGKGFVTKNTIIPKNRMLKRKRLTFVVFFFSQRK